VVIADRCEELAAFCLRHFAEEPGGTRRSSNGYRADLGDEEILSLALSARNAAKFEALWAGETTGYASHSEAAEDNDPPHPAVVLVEPEGARHKQDERREWPPGSV